MLFLFFSIAASKFCVLIAIFDENRHTSYCYMLPVLELPNFHWSILSNSLCPAVVVLSVTFHSFKNNEMTTINYTTEYIHISVEQ